MSSDTEKVKERLSIADVVSSYIKIEKAGANFKAKCPFHNEKTPSFFISPDRGTFYCFGCGAKGDIFSFVEQMEGLEFYDALKMLAERAGVELSGKEKRTTAAHDDLYLLLEKATLFFEEELKKSAEAKQYLAGRNVSARTINEWRVGYAPDEWRSLLGFFSGSDLSKLEKVGLIKRKASDASAPISFYDVFRDRIIFPIFDQSGRVVGFSGRILHENPKAPKYLNSPDTPLFNKSEILYGLNKAKVAIRKRDFSILVEGQMDLLACHQAGFDNTIATSGTALTRAHLERLKKISNRIVMAFDSDGAGFAAASRSAGLALELGMEVKIADLPSGTDPADLIGKDKEVWKETLKHSKHLIDFHLDKLLAGNSDRRIVARQIKEKILPYIVALGSSLEQAHFVGTISERTGLPENAIWNDLKSIKAVGDGEERGSVTPSALPKQALTRRDTLERKIAGLLFLLESRSNTGLSHDDALKIFSKHLGADTVSAVVERFSPEKERILFETEIVYKDKVSEKEVKELENFYREIILRDALTDTGRSLKEAEKQGEKEKTKKLLKHFHELSTQIEQLSKQK